MRRKGRRGKGERVLKKGQKRRRREDLEEGPKEEEKRGS